MPRTVLLRHVLPDGSEHVDWFFERRDGDALLAAFRLDRRLDQPSSEPIEATQIPDHRAAYLDFQGEISGGRGRVERLAAGTIDLLAFDNAQIHATIRLGAWTGQVRGVHAQGSAWRLAVAGVSPHDGPGAR